jgi:hypothetical protein
MRIFLLLLAVAIGVFGASLPAKPKVYSSSMVGYQQNNGQEPLIMVLYAAVSHEDAMRTDLLTDVGPTISFQNCVNNTIFEYWPLLDQCHQVQFQDAQCGGIFEGLTESKYVGEEEMDGKVCDIWYYDDGLGFTVYYAFAGDTPCAFNMSIQETSSHSSGRVNMNMKEKGPSGSTEAFDFINYQASVADHFMKLPAVCTQLPPMHPPGVDASHSQPASFRERMVARLRNGITVQ